MACFAYPYIPNREICRPIPPTPPMYASPSQPIEPNEANKPAGGSSRINKTREGKGRPRVTRMYLGRGKEMRLDEPCL